MTVLTVKGATVREALLRARQSLGEKALVVSRVDVPGGVVIAVSSEVPRTPQALAAMRHEARQLLARPAAHVTQVGTSELESRLLRAGASRRLVERTCEAVAGRLLEGAHPFDLAAEELSLAFPTLNLRRAKGSRLILALVGNAGAGKSTTAAKLAGRLQAAGRSTALVTIDLDRPGARAQAGHNGRLMGVPVAPAREAARLTRLFLAERGLECVVLDMTGQQDKDRAQLERLRAAIAESPVPIELLTLGVLPMTSSTHALALFLAQAGELDGAILTKTDENDLAAPVLELCSERSLPIAFLSNGRALATDLVRASGESLADFLLRGKVA